MDIDKAGKKKLRQRLNEAMEAKGGFIVICNDDKGIVTDFYQDICVVCIIRRVTAAVMDFNKIFKTLPGHQAHEKVRQKKSRMDQGAN